MTCTTPRATSTPATTVAVMTAAATLSLPAPATIRAQTTPATPTPAAPQPVVTTAVPAVIAAYRAPALALVQPSASGGALTVPQDKPVVVFRFAQGEADDPVDAATFRVSVDGRDRTALFQIAAGQAWGPLGEPSSGASSGTSALVSAGAHQVAARVCSSRGACGDVAVTVTAVASPAATATAEHDAAKAGEKSRRGRVLDLVLQAARKLLVP